MQTYVHVFKVIAIKIREFVEVLHIAASLGEAVTSKEAKSNKRCLLSLTSFYCLSYT
jgi:hypothetical protein